MKKWSPYNYTGLNFKLTKYLHLELILSENKLTYTKHISNATHFEMKIKSERSKEKKKSKTPKKRETLFRAMSPAPVLLFELTHSGLSALRVITLRAYPFGIICATSHLYTLLSSQGGDVREKPGHDS